jgi:hypothetical protein
MPADQADLDWWLALAPTLTWTWAKTYAATAPHWYIVEGRTPNVERDDYLRAGRVIRTFGEPGRYWSMTNLYLYSRDRRLKMWAMWSSPPRDDDATLINLAHADRVYGPQTGFDRQRVAQLRLPPS